MKIKILLINPWIYDFAAADLWSRPLGLFAVAEYLSCYDTGLFFIDCTDNGTRNGYGRGRYQKAIVGKPDCLRQVPRRFGRYGISPDEFVARLRGMPVPDVVFMTSVMSYWYPGVQEAVGIVRRQWGGIPVVLGGIYATLWHEHAAATSGADLICKGPVSDQIRFGLGTFGFRIKKIRDSRVPHRDLGIFPGTTATALLTSSGCPFRCSYCASRLMHDTFSQRNPEEVIDDLVALQKRGVRDVAFYDDALLVAADSHIKVILRGVLHSAGEVRFHCPNGLHARLIDNELARLMRASGFSTIRLGFETVRRERQESTGGKVSADDLVRAVTILKKEGFTKEDIGVYLMYGLPGQPLDEVREGIAFLKSLAVRIHLSEFSPVPGTVSWEELVRQGVISHAIDPLLTNNTVFPYLFSGYDHEELRQLKLAVKEYNISK